jgi:hypothetical protein
MWPANQIKDVRDPNADGVYVFSGKRGGQAPFCRIVSLPLYDQATSLCCSKRGKLRSGKKEPDPGTLNTYRRRRRRSAIEPKIGHLKSDHRMDRCFLAGLRGDAINAVLAAAGANLRKLLRRFVFALICWLREAFFTRSNA